MAKSKEGGILFPSQKISPEKAAAIAASLGVEFDGENFRIKTHFSNGAEVTHIVLGRDNIAGMPIEDYIKAVQKFYPTIESGKDFDLEAARKMISDTSKDSKE
jgi:hypothetical protein